MPRTEMTYLEPSAFEAICALTSEFGKPVDDSEHARQGMCLNNNIDRRTHLAG